MAARGLLHNYRRQPTAKNNVERRNHPYDENETERPPDGAPIGIDDGVLAPAHPRVRGNLGRRWKLRSCR